MEKILKFSGYTLATQPHYSETGLSRDQFVKPPKTLAQYKELDYLITFHQSITQAMARTMQDLSEDVL